MTLVERTPNPIFASMSPKKFLIRQITGHDAEGAPEKERRTAAQSHEARGASQNGDDPFYGDHASARHLIKVITAADAEAARIIGIVGAKRGTGTSVTSRQLAGAFASFGRKTLLVDASRAEFLRAGDEASSFVLPALDEYASEVRPSLSVVDLATATGAAPLAPSELARALSAAITDPARTIIVDLPPITEETGLPNPSISDLAGACDLVFLVCLTGAMRRNELAECVETCKVVGLALNGLILNDWRLPASRILER